MDKIQLAKQMYDFAKENSTEELIKTFNNATPSKEKTEFFNKWLKFINKQFKAVKEERPIYTLENYMDVINSGAFHLNNEDEDFNTGFFRMAFFVWVAFEKDGYLYANEHHEVLFHPLKLEQITVASLNEIIKNHNAGLPEVIIAKNGDVYPVRYDHVTLATLLTLHGLNLKGAVRVNASAAQIPTINLSSMFACCCLDLRFTTEKTICLTKEQANAIYSFCDNLKKCNKKCDCSIIDVLQRSENLGWQMIGVRQKDLAFYNNRVAEHNLGLILDEIYEKYNPKSVVHKDQSVFELIPKVKEDNKRNIAVITESLEAGNGVGV